MALVPVLFVLSTRAQPKENKISYQPASSQLAEFKRITAKADVNFIKPRYFREVKAVNNEDFTFDYAMDVPGRDFYQKTLPPEVLKRYNADAGKSYLLTLLDKPETKRYRYALLIALQKYHTGTALMVCFTNQKGPAFYKYIEQAGESLTFFPSEP